MNVFVLRNATTGAALGAVAKADNLWERMIGLLLHDVIAPNDGMWLEPCNAIHTIGMRAHIDVIFLDQCGRVIRALANIGPHRPAIFCAGAHVAIEVGHGTLERCHVRVGDRITLEPPMHTA